MQSPEEKASIEKRGESKVAKPVLRETLVSVFAKLTVEELEAKKEESKKPITMLSSDPLNVRLEDIYPPDSILDFPKRPNWTYTDSKQDLEQREQVAFEAWLSHLKDVASQRKQQNPHHPPLSYFEQNLNVWRQLWRVLEVSDVLVVVVDARHPLLGFPPSLYHHIVHDLKKPILVVFQKVDLVPVENVNAWKHYFETMFPGVAVTSFASFVSFHELVNGSEGFGRKSTKGSKSKNETVAGRRIRYASYVHVVKLLEACQSLLKHTSDHGVNVDWADIIETLKMTMMQRIQNIRKKQARQDAKDQGLGRVEKRRQNQEIRMRSKQKESESEAESSSTDEEDCDNDDKYAGQYVEQAASPDDMSTEQKRWITLGMIGYPNAGKSSLINGILGRKVVSVSKTPGHTKHFQTIHITETLRLCDCPGLVFPSFIPRELQILFGMYNVAQVQEPYTVISYLAQRVNLPRLLGIDSPSQMNTLWSGWSISEAYAEKKGFFTPKGRTDAYRSANLILRMANEGKLNLVVLPPKEYTISVPLKSSISSIPSTRTTDNQKGRRNKKIRKRITTPDSESSQSSAEEDPQPIESCNAFSVLDEFGM